MHISIDDLIAKAGGRPGKHDTDCPECGPHRHSPKNRKREVLAFWLKPELDFASYYCARCGISGHVRADTPAEISPAQIQRNRAEAERQEAEHAAERLRKARYLYDKARPAIGSIAETYLRARIGEAR